MHTLIINLTALFIAAAIIIFVNYILLRHKGEGPSRKFLEVNPARLLISLSILIIISTGLLFYFQREIEHKFQKEMELQKILLERNYAKEVALVEWKNKMFTSETQLNKDLAQAKKDYALSEKEVKMWRGIAENNTIANLMPKRDTKEVLNEYQTRLKKSLASIQSGQTLMNSDIRVITDNINTIRLIGQEYEKVIAGFQELHDSMVAANNSGTVMERPKQKKVLFFPVKQKEYEQLLEQYYQSQGNQQAVANISVKLQQTIDQAREEFRAINKKFEENLAFVENSSNGLSFNADKLQNLIEATISEAEIVNDTSEQTDIKIKKKTNKN